MSSGVRSCTSDSRTTTLTTSDAPSAASATSDSAKCRDNPNTIVAMPNAITPPNIARPGRPFSGNRVSQRPRERRRPQAPHAARRSPTGRPAGCRARRSAAARSRRRTAPRTGRATAPRIAGSRRMNAIPENTERSVTGSRAGGALRSGIVPLSTAATANATTLVPNAAGAPRHTAARRTRPEDLRAAYFDVDSAVARGRSVRGTTAGSSDDTDGDSNARAVLTIAPRARVHGRCGPATCVALSRNTPARLTPQTRCVDDRAVGHLPDDERQREHRHELREADETERERVVRERVDVPADGNRQDLESQGGHDARAPETLERTWRNRLAGNGDKGLESGTESVIEVWRLALRAGTVRNDGARRRVRATTVPTRPKRDDMPTRKTGRTRGCRFRRPR